MKLITRDTDYALRALCCLAKSKRTIISVSELVGSLEVPRPFLRKILQTLNKKRLLKSHKGQGGGFRLVRKAEKIFLLDLIRIFQGPLNLNECLLKKAPCPNTKGCKLKKKIDNIQQFIIAEFKNVTLASLMEGR